MESLETAALLFDNLLDFSSDIGEEDDDDSEKKKNPLPLQTTIESNNNSAELTISDSDTHHASFPGMVEEELEWLSNEDAFPPIETFDILSVKPDIIPKNQSPVSVLGNSSNIRVPVKVPVKARSKRRRRRRSSFTELLGQQWWYRYEPKKESVAATRMWRASSSGRKCLHCQADKTPQWRAGPLGPKTLCNACGVRYKSGRLLPEYRPASSPTFSEQLHSNSHRKILDMRKQKQKDIYFESPDKEVFFQSSDKGFETMKKNLRATRMSTTTLSVRRCQHCQAERTSEWIEEPFGPKTFCNACGMKYKSDCPLPEYRPVNSPSFHGELHSNFHTKMLDVRRQKQKETFLHSSYEGTSDLLGS